jgi:hypothetical protein
VNEPEERLGGGNVGGAVRVGDTVRRTAGPWTPTVHALLAHLRTRGVAGVPAAHGLDEQGREVLDYIAGVVPEGDPFPEWTRTAEALSAVARLIRNVHDASADFAGGDARWQRMPGAPADGPVICHNDLAPYNTVYVSGRPIGLIDWDYAAPGPRNWDLAHAAWRHIPLSDGAPVEWAAHRLRLFCDAYGLTRRAGLVDVVARRQQALHDTIRAFAAQGHPAFAAMWDTHHSEQPLRDRVYLLAHRAEFERALR